MGTIRLIFKDTELNEQLHKDGFVVVPFLEEKEVDNLKEVFQTLHPEEQIGFYASSHVPDRTFRRLVNDAIQAVFNMPMNKLFAEVNGLGGAFISKAPGEKGVLPLHQDWNIVDESLWRSYNLWVPLVDVSEFNGAVMVLKGSHLKRKLFRGPNLPPILSNIASEVLPHMEVIPMCKGQALIYDHALWHASNINNSAESRTVAVYGLAPKGAALKYYYLQDNLISEYNANPEFYLYGNPLAGPANLELNKRYPSNQRQLTKREFYKIYGKKLPVNQSRSLVGHLLNKLKWIFGW
jgi:hypothetical protein